MRYGHARGVLAASVKRGASRPRHPPGGPQLQAD